MRSRSKRQNLTRCQVSCSKSFRTIFGSELLKSARSGTSGKKYQRSPIEIVCQNSLRELFVSNSYIWWSLPAPCSLFLGRSASHWRQKLQCTVLWSWATMAGVEIEWQARSGILSIWSLHPHMENWKGKMDSILSFSHRRWAYKNYARLPAYSSVGRLSSENCESGSFKRGRCRWGRSKIPHFLGKLQQSAPAQRTNWGKWRKKRKTKKAKRIKKEAKKSKEEQRSKEKGNPSKLIYANPFTNLPSETPGQLQDAKPQDPKFLEKSSNITPRAPTPNSLKRTQAMQNLGSISWVVFVVKCRFPFSWIGVSQTERLLDGVLPSYGFHFHCIFFSVFFSVNSSLSMIVLCELCGKSSEMDWQVEIWPALEIMSLQTMWKPCS